LMIILMTQLSIANWRHCELISLRRAEAPEPGPEGTAGSARIWFRGAGEPLRHAYERSPAGSPPLVTLADARKIDAIRRVT
jgi:hypothetical protein